MTVPSTSPCGSRTFFFRGPGIMSSTNYTNMLSTCGNTPKFPYVPTCSPRWRIVAQVGIDAPAHLEDTSEVAGEAPPDGDAFVAHAHRPACPMSVTAPSPYRPSPGESSMSVPKLGPPESRDRPVAVRYLPERR